MYRCFCVFSGIWALLFMLTGCQLLPQQKVDKAELQQRQIRQVLARYQAQPVPVGLQGQHRLSQFSFSGVIEQQMLMQLEFETQVVKFAAMTVEGMPLLQASWQPGQQLDIRDSKLPESVVAMVLRDLQLVHWPLASIKSGFSKHLTKQESKKLTLKQSKPVNTALKPAQKYQTRQLFWQQGLIIDIKYAADAINLINYLDDYRLVIKKL